MTDLGLYCHLFSNSLYTYFNHSQIPICMTSLFPYVYISFSFHLLFILFFHFFQMHIFLLLVISLHH